jgi:Holliday junction resolvase RusA-like endonuclease
VHTAGRFRSTHFIEFLPPFYSLQVSKMDNLRIRSVDSMMVDKTLYLRLWGEPIAQPRPRVRRGLHGRIRVYDPSTRFRDAGRILINSDLDEIGLRNRPVFATGRSLRVTAYYFLDDSRKDIDNLLKFTLDLLVGPVMVDDRFISEFRAIKTKEPLDGDYHTDAKIEYVE